MTKFPDYNIPSVRLTSGMYALTKLAGAGLTLMLITLVMIGFPQSDGIPEGWPISIPYAIYAYGLPAVLVADALLHLLRNKSKSFVLPMVIYTVAGFGAGLWLASEQGAELWLWGMGGIVGLLILRLTGLVVERLPLLLPVFALFIPLLCLLLI